MSWALFHRSARAQPLWLATASACALMACPVAAQQTVEPPPVAIPEGQPDLQDRDVIPAAPDAPAPTSEEQIGFAADALNYDNDADIVVADWTCRT